MSDFSAKGAVVHEKDVKVLDVSDCEFLEAVGQEESSLLVRSVSNLGHLLVASESSSHAIVDTCLEWTVPWALLQLGASLPA